jgi:deoxyadenosine/deoxycytidine kinase
MSRIVFLVVSLLFCSYGFAVPSMPFFFEEFDAGLRKAVYVDRIISTEKRRVVKAKNSCLQTKPFQYVQTFPGKIITLAGISGIGKSTMARELANICSIESVLEPEESSWPEIIRQHEKHDPFNVLLAFRQMWLVGLNKAEKLRANGRTCILDTFFIKILHYQLGKPGIQWLFPDTNPYSDILYSLTKMDLTLLPDPDYIILLDCSFEDWNALLASRGRKFDQNTEFNTSFENSKALIEESVMLLAKDRNIPVLRFHVMYGNITEQALRLRSFLYTNHLLDKPND